MALFSLGELVELALMILIVGYIFKDVFRAPVRTPDVLTMEQGKNGAYELHGVPHVDISQFGGVTKSDFFFAVLVTAPAIALHEMGHKFVALGLGNTAVFHASYGGLMIGLMMKVLFGWVFFIPGFVSHSGLTTPLEAMLISFAGPAINLLLWQGSKLALKGGFLRGHEHALHLTMRINKLLFFLNMIPFPPFDGFSVFYGLFKMIF